jgi:hypothetical protein
MKFFLDIDLETQIKDSKFSSEFDSKRMRNWIKERNSIYFVRIEREKSIKLCDKS